VAVKGEPIEGRRGMGGTVGVRVLVLVRAEGVLGTGYGHLQVGRWYIADSDPANDYSTCRRVWGFLRIHGRFGDVSWGIHVNTSFGEGMGICAEHGRHSFWGSNTLVYDEMEYEIIHLAYQFCDNNNDNHNQRANSR
jgi:hypothetical protein